jgi:FixJ family two-component response regulator
MTADDHIVFIVDDDARLREALSELLDSHGIRAAVFGSAGEYIGADKPNVPACLILDVELPDINGLDLQRQIANGDHPPIVFITGHGDIPSSVRRSSMAHWTFSPSPSATPISWLRSRRRLTKTGNGGLRVPKWTC